MYIQQMSLQAFRNYSQLSLRLHPSLNIFYGDNAQGKTNIVEAIYMCATGRSQRTHMEKELIQFSQRESHIQVFMHKNGREERIDVHLKKEEKKGVAINGIPIRRLGDLLGTMHVIIFSPEDLQLIKSGPAERRRFLDIEICQMNAIYYHDLQQYFKVLKQRNNLLKNIQKKSQPHLKETLFVWDDQLIAYGTRLIKVRGQFLDKMNELAEKIHRQITGQKEHLELVYRPNVNIEDFAVRVKKSFERDILQGNTSVGPHKDDIHFMVNGMDVRVYGSQGQQRTAALSAKLAEIELVKQEIQDSPILLLDDVLSELDESRQAYLLDHIQDIQTVLTCTGIEDAIRKQTQKGFVFKVVDGQVERR